MTIYEHPQTRIWICEAVDCGREYQTAADTQPYKWRGRIVCPAHAGDPGTTAFVADAITEGRPVVEVDAQL